MKKTIVFALVLALLLLATACGGGGTSSQAPASSAGSSEAAGSTAAPAAPEGEAAIKVALCLVGPVNDGAWSAYAYEAVMAAKENYNIEVLYTENVKPTEMEAVFTDYASQGCKLIIGHSFSFGDAAISVGERFPDVAFAIIDGSSEAENVASYNLATHEQGYIEGMMAAMMTESRKVGCVAGFEGPAIIKVVEAFKLGVRAVDPDIEIMTAYTGSWDDAAKSKEAAQAMIDKGADFLLGSGNQGNAGLIKACEEADIYCIGELDQQSLAPNHVIMCNLQDITGLVAVAIEEAMEGRFTGGIRGYGFADGVMSFTDYGELDSVVPQEVKDMVEQSIEDIISGKLQVPQIEEITPD